MVWFFHDHPRQVGSLAGTTLDEEAVLNAMDVVNRTSYKTTGARGLLTFAALRASLGQMYAVGSDGRELLKTR